MRIDSSGKLVSTTYETKLTKEERIEHDHAELIRSLRSIKREDPIEYEKMIRAFENHAIIAARYRLYALTREGHVPDSREKIIEISDLQKYIGDFEMTMVDWPTGDTFTSSNENYDEWNEEDDSESELLNE